MRFMCCCSSVVERVIGNDEVGSSILPSSTIFLPVAPPDCLPARHARDVGEIIKRPKPFRLVVHRRYRARKAWVGKRREHTARYKAFADDMPDHLDDQIFKQSVERDLTPVKRSKSLTNHEIERRRNRGYVVERDDKQIRHAERDGIALPPDRLTLLVGSYAQARYLPATKKLSLSERVRNFASFGPQFLPLPHPSWRSTGWMARNGWFESDVLPAMQMAVRQYLGSPGQA